MIYISIGEVMAAIYGLDGGSVNMKWIQVGLLRSYIYLRIVGEW